VIDARADAHVTLTSPRPPTARPLSQHTRRSGGSRRHGQAGAGSSKTAAADSPPPQQHSRAPAVQTAAPRRRSAGPRADRAPAAEPGRHRLRRRNRLRSKQGARQPGDGPRTTITGWPAAASPCGHDAGASCEIAGGRRWSITSSAPPTAAATISLLPVSAVHGRQGEPAPDSRPSGVPPAHRKRGTSSISFPQAGAPDSVM
jgi:hypothetical protein